MNELVRPLTAREVNDLLPRRVMVSVGPIRRSIIGLTWHELNGIGWRIRIVGLCLGPRWGIAIEIREVAGLPEEESA